MANPHVKYFKARFTGILHVHEHALFPFYQVNHLEWEQLKFTDVIEIKFYDFWEEQTNNSWSRKVVKPYKNNVLSRQVVWNWPKITKAKAFPWIRGVKWRLPRMVRRTQVIINVEENTVINDVLHSVVLKRIEVLDAKDTWNGAYQRASGQALFQLHTAPPVVKKKVIKPIASSISAEAVSDPSVLSTNAASSIGITDISSLTEPEVLKSQINNRRSHGSLRQIARARPRTLRPLFAQILHLKHLAPYHHVHTQIHWQSGVLPHGDREKLVKPVQGFSLHGDRFG